MVYFVSFACLFIGAIISQAPIKNPLAVLVSRLLTAIGIFTLFISIVVFEVFGGTL